MSVKLQILHVFLNKERENWWKTIGKLYTGRRRYRSAAFLEHDNGHLYDDLLLFDEEINQFLLNFICWALGMGTFR